MKLIVGRGWQSSAGWMADWSMYGPRKSKGLKKGLRRRTQASTSCWGLKGSETQPILDRKADVVPFCLALGKNLLVLLYELPV